jgi:hypothetical protein
MASDQRLLGAILNSAVKDDRLLWGIRAGCVYVIFKGLMGVALRRINFHRSVRIAWLRTRNQAMNVGFRPNTSPPWARGVCCRRLFRFRC